MRNFAHKAKGLVKNPQKANETGDIPVSLSTLHPSPLLPMFQKDQVCLTLHVRVGEYRLDKVQGTWGLTPTATGKYR